VEVLDGTPLVIYCLDDFEGSTVPCTQLHGGVQQLKVCILQPDLVTFLEWAEMTLPLPPFTILHHQLLHFLDCALCLFSDLFQVLPSFCQLWEIHLFGHVVDSGHKAY
jgi:hypothetical protein